jgi:hypothetical protein
MRPNIRVEIQNNLVEAMDVDENEEGEISDNDAKETPETQLEKLEPDQSVYKAAKPAFMTGVDILDKREQAKLQERARRFCLNPEEIKNFRDEDLQLLHGSLGITPSNESNVRFEVIHLRGIEQMNAADILDYFLEYAPVSVEWIDEESCNVVWLDRISSARAVHFMSKPVRGMPVRDDTSYFDNLQESEEINESVLLVNKNREVELQEEGEPLPNKLLNEKNSVDIADITTTIPPGYWRLGNKHPKAKCLLLRFALKTDKKHFKTEQFSRYYKTQGKKNVKVGVAAVGRQMITQGIFGRNKDMHKSGDNPWGVLAKNWDEDAQFREKERAQDSAEPKVEIKNQSLRVRLGTKRKEEEESDSEKSEPPKKVKIPRMRMYADEEEEKIKRKKMLKRINHQIRKIEEDAAPNSDLRTVLNMTSRTHGVKLEQAEPEVFDLGTTLKNRNKKMVFEIKTEADQDKRLKEYRHLKPSRERTTVRDRISRRYSNSDDEDFNDGRGDYGHGKPRSKVAVVIKTQKKPSVASAVASTVWSRVSDRCNESESGSESESNESEHSSPSENEEVDLKSRLSSRPGFGAHLKERSLKQNDYKSPLKIEINNDHFKRT